MPQEILQKYWGYSSFRPLQEDIIQSAMQGNDTLALLPTGGGKSICFQVPALAKKGICIVVSPLIALMKDQVANLNKRGIKAIAIYSGQSSAEIDIAVDNCVYGDIKFLYLSPERLKTDLIRARLPKMNVNLLAIDEAHCISQWGYDFRPPYLEIAEVRELLPNTPVLALTATATTEVMQDICQRLEFKNEKIFVKSFVRENLTYATIHEENKLERLLRICQKVPGTGIVYVRNRKKTREISDYLRMKGIPADFYHAGLDTPTRDQKQLDWTTEKIRVVVSTNAFGMGIDKPNVRFVVHMDLPDSPEAYFQEAGRAGRDEKKAYAVLLYNKSDLIDLDRFFENTFPPIDFVKKIYNLLGNYLQLAVGAGKDKTFDFLFNDFCHRYDLERFSTFSALKFLEKEGYIYMSDALSNPSRIIILLNKEELYRFMVANPFYDTFLKVFLRSYTGLFSEFTRIDEHEIAYRLKSRREDVSNHLKKLHKMRILHYLQENTLPTITFIGGRYQHDNISISTATYQKRKDFALHRLKAMKEYVLSEKRCRNLILLDYFGEKRNDRCGKCDICLERNKLDLSKMEFDEVIRLIKPVLSDKSLTIKELINNLKTNVPEKRIIKAIQWLTDNGKICINTENETIRWKN